MPSTSTPFQPPMSTATSSCGIRCFSERKAHCKDLHKWGRNLLYMIGLECVAKQMTKVSSWTQISPFLQEDKKVAIEKGAGIKKASRTPIDWTPTDYCPVCLGKRFSTVEGEQTPMPDKASSSAAAGGSSKPSQHTNDPPNKNAVNGGVGTTNNGGIEAVTSSTNHEHQQPHQQPKLNFDHLFGDGGLTAATAANSMADEAAAAANPFMSMINSSSALYHPFQFMGAGFGQLPLLHQLMQWSGGGGGAYAPYGGQSNASAAAAAAYALQSQLSSSLLGGGASMADLQQLQLQQQQQQQAAAAFYAPFDASQWLPQLTVPPEQYANALELAPQTPQTGVTVDAVRDETADKTTKEHMPTTSKRTTSNAQLEAAAAPPCTTTDDQPLDLSKKTTRDKAACSSTRSQGAASSSQQPKRNYSQSDLDAAVKDIRSGRLGTRRASVVYGIPRSTLRNKIYKLEAAVENGSASLETDSPTAGATKRVNGGGKGGSRAFVTTSPLSVSQQNSPSSDSMEQGSPLPPPSSYAHVAPSSSNDAAAAVDSDVVSGAGLASMDPMGVAALTLNPWLDVTQSDWNTFWTNLVANQQAAVSAAAAAQMNLTPSSAALIGGGPSCAQTDEHNGGAVAMSPAKDLTNGRRNSASTAAAEQLSTTTSSPESTATTEKLQDTQPPPTATTATGRKRKTADRFEDADDDLSKDKSRPKRGQYRRYDRNALDEAVKAVRRGEMSVHRAGSYYGVPHSTLEYKVKERNLIRANKKKQLQQQLQQTQQLRSESTTSSFTGDGVDTTLTTTPTVGTDPTDANSPTTQRQASADLAVQNVPPPTADDLSTDASTAAAAIGFWSQLSQLAFAGAGGVGGVNGGDVAETTAQPLLQGAGDGLASDDVQHQQQLCQMVSKLQQLQQQNQMTVTTSPSAALDCSGGVVDCSVAASTPSVN